MSREKTDFIRKEETRDRLHLPSRQRALIFQGGGALGAYEAGVYRVLHDWIYKNITASKRNENFFDVIAGTSIGAINGAIIVSYLLKKKREANKNRKPDSDKSMDLPEYWYGSADVLESFWNGLPISNFLMDIYDSSFWPWEYFHIVNKSMKQGWNDILDRSEQSIVNIWKNNTGNVNNPFVKEWFDLLRFYTEAWDIPPSTEAARRHYSTMTFASPNVASAIIRQDLKFWTPLGSKVRGEQRRVPFYWGYPNYSLREACRSYILDLIKTDSKQYEPRLLFVTVDVQSGDTISFDSYDTKTKYDEYDENAEEDGIKLDDQYDHLITYPNGIEWEQLSTTFSMPELYRYATLEDESLNHEKVGKKRTYWDGGMSSNTPLRELISQHKEYWSCLIGDENLWDGEKGTKIPSLDVYIADVWPAKITDYPVPSDNDFVLSRKSNLLLMDKTEYEESVTKMITQYMHLIERLLKSLNDNDKSAAKKEVLEAPIIDSVLNRKGIKKYRDLLKGNFDIDRMMRIERKDDTYAIGLAMADFSAPTIRQLMAVGKYDALDKLITTLSFTLQELSNKELKNVPHETKKRLHDRLEDARNTLGKNANDIYQYNKVMDHLYNFVDEVNMLESMLEKDKVLGKDSKGVAELLRP